MDTMTETALTTPHNDFDRMNTNVLDEPKPTLDDAVERQVAPDSVQPPPSETAKPFEPAQLIGLIAELSSLDMPSEVQKSYQEDYKSNPLVWIGVNASGICDALAKYGVGASGGNLPDWLKVVLGVGALTAGVVLTRRKYTNGLESPVAQPVGRDSVGDSGSVGGFNTPPAPNSDLNFGFANPHTA